MSKKVYNLKILKKVVKIKKNSQFIRDYLIEYNKDQLSMDVFEIMKEGYKEMAIINL